MKLRSVVCCGVVALLAAITVYVSMRPTNESALTARIIGVWEEPGRSYEFHKDGKYITTLRTKDGSILTTFEGTFHVKENALIVTLDDLRQEITIVEVSDEELVIRPFKSDPATINVLKRVK